MALRLRIAIDLALMLGASCFLSIVAFAIEAGHPQRAASRTGNPGKNAAGRQPTTTTRQALIKARASETKTPIAQRAVAATTAITGKASMYNPVRGTYKSGGLETASGERYDGTSWTGAIRTDLRHKFGGVRFGKSYQPSYALVEGTGKRVIIRINDVGPLASDRVIDLNEGTMRHFDATLRLGLVPSVKVTPLAGHHWMVGPVANETLSVIRVRSSASFAPKPPLADGRHRHAALAVDKPVVRTAARISRVGTAAGIDPARSDRRGSSSGAPVIRKTAAAAPAAGATATAGDCGWRTVEDFTNDGRVIHRKESVCNQGERADKRDTAAVAPAATAGDCGWQTVEEFTNDGRVIHRKESLCSQAGRTDKREPPAAAPARPEIGAGV